MVIISWIFTSYWKLLPYHVNCFSISVSYSASEPNWISFMVLSTIGQLFGPSSLIVAIFHVNRNLSFYTTWQFPQESRTNDVFITVIPASLSFTMRDFWTAVWGWLVRDNNRGSYRNVVPPSCYKSARGDYRNRAIHRMRSQSSVISEAQ